MRIVLLGPPGAGKGTLANAIKEKYAFAHISMGDILREEMKSNSPLGQQVKGFVESGGLVPDDVVTKIIEQKLTQSDVAENGFLLDGFPRTEKQAMDLDAILGQIKKPIDSTIYLDASLPVIVQRLGGRRVCRSCGALYHLTNMPPKVQGKCDICGAELYQRPDDNEATIKTRLEVYIKNTEPIIDYYRQQEKLRRLNADKGIPELLQHFEKIVDEWKKSNSH